MKHEEEYEQRKEFCRTNVVVLLPRQEQLSLEQLRDAWAIIEALWDEKPEHL